MTDVTIPGWALLLMFAVFIPWLVWLTMSTQKNKQDIAINTATDSSVGKSIDGLNSKIDKLDHKFDLFLSQEINFLKQQLKS